MCDCATKVNEALKEFNARLATSFRLFDGVGMGLERVMIQTEKLRLGVRNAKRPPFVLASFCPFCGEKVERPEDQPPILEPQE